jgi:hypothetical protein
LFVLGLGFGKIEGLGLRVRFRVYGLWFMVYGLGVLV